MRRAFAGGFASGMCGVELLGTETLAPIIDEIRQTIARIARLISEEREAQRWTTRVRFVIPERTRRPNLASKALAHAVRALPGHWQEHFGYEPLLCETFTDIESHQGTCYKAAGWTPLGLTAGNSRQRAKRVGAIVRHHWKVENNIHYFCRYRFFKAVPLARHSENENNWKTCLRKPHSGVWW